jgi:hypothetical protein
MRSLGWLFAERQPAKMAEARKNETTNRKLVLRIVAKFIALTGFDHLLDWFSDFVRVADQGIRALRRAGFYIHETGCSRFDEALRTLHALQAEYYYDCKLSKPKSFLPINHRNGFAQLVGRLGES